MSRQFLKIKFSLKSFAKQNGIKFDREVKRWYIEEGQKLDDESQQFFELEDANKYLLMSKNQLIKLIQQLEQKNEEDELQIDDDILQSERKTEKKKIRTIKNLEVSKKKVNEESE